MTDTDAFFDTAKVPVYLDSITHATEDRRGTETKIIILGCRVDPMDAKLALSLDQRVRNSLFRLADAEPVTHIRAAEFALGVPTQNLTLFATPDTEKASRALLQVKISGVRAKVAKDAVHYSLTFKASFGPADKSELEFVERWRGNTTFVSFERVEPGLELDADADDEIPPATTPRPAPMWDDGAQPDQAAAPESEAAREVGSKAPAKRGRKKAGKHDPDVERARQASAGKTKAAKGGKANGAAHA